MSVIKVILGLLFFLLVVGLLMFYWFLPGGIDFGSQSGNSNFSVEYGSEEMQFYKNMRFSTPSISYKILNCPLQKEDEMEYSFEILSNKSVLNFYPVAENEDISITCDSTNRIEGGLFIAGEGGPTNITQAGEFNVIQHGKILLIRESKCANPNVGLHELFHVLGFKHSSNKNNIMYNISKCDQVIGEDIIRLIDELYSYPTYPDLVFENVSAKIEARFLSTNISVRNNGLADAGESEIIIYVNGKQIKKVDLESLEIGFGRMIILEKVFISSLVVDSLEFEIRYTGEELEKENNRIKLNID